MNPEVLISELVLRLIGAFYCFGTIIGARMVTRYSFLDHALEAISGKKQPRAERLREQLMLAGMAPVFAGGLALMFLAPIATWLFVLSAIWQAVYLGYVAPRYLDPEDDPGEEGRAKTWRAFWFYLVATVLVLAAAYAGLLRGPSGVAALGGVAAASAIFGGWIVWSMRNKLKSDASPFAALSTNPNDPSEGWDDLSKSGFKIREPKDISVVLRPSWNDGYLFHTDRMTPSAGAGRRNTCPSMRRTWWVTSAMCSATSATPMIRGAARYASRRMWRSSRKRARRFSKSCRKSSAPSAFASSLCPRLSYRKSPLTA